MNVRRWLLCAVGCGACFSGAATAHAESEGFALDRFEPSERGSDWFVTDSLDMRGDQRPAVGVVFDYAHDPLVIHDANGDRASVPVSDQLFAHVGGSAVVANRVRFALSLPVQLLQRGDDATPANPIASDQSTTTGDLRAAVDLRLFGKYRGPASLAAGFRFTLPSGSQSSFTGDGSPRLGPRLMLAGDLSLFAYALEGGFTYRGNDGDFASAKRGSELNVAASLGVRVLDGHLLLGPELFGSTVVSDSDAMFAKRTTPVELIIGGHLFTSSGFRVGAGAGPGLTHGIGSPAFRGLLTVEWSSPYRETGPNDADGDGVLDARDACPDTPGVSSDEPKKNGCPVADLPDEDGDSVPDDKDACRTTPGISSEDPELNGCPDRDRDGVIDRSDACPEEAGEESDDPKANGCPPAADGDADGIENSADACPNAAGPANSDPKKNGCPLAHVEQGQIRISEQLQFAYRSARILPASDAVLEAVLRILQDNPAIKKVSVEGHTDDRGPAAINLQLSQARARAAMIWLVRHGVAPSRLVAKGWGAEHPLTTNDTAEGRSTNRRVEFDIVEQSGANAE